jgi:hypothetical protein
VFGGDVSFDYRRLREQGFDGCRVEVNYRRAAEIYPEFGDQHSAAGTNHQFDTLAQDRRRLAGDG